MSWGILEEKDCLIWGSLFDIDMVAVLVMIHAEAPLPGLVGDEPSQNDWHHCGRIGGSPSISFVSITNWGGLFTS